MAIEACWRVDADTRVAADTRVVTDMQVRHIAGGRRYAIEACWRVGADMQSRRVSVLAQICQLRRVGVDMAIEAD